MAAGDPPGGADFPFGDLNKLFGNLANGDPWDQAVQVAQSVANEGASEPNVDPLQRMAILDLSRVAELNIGQAVGIHLPETTTIRPVTRAEWISESMAIYRPFFERFSDALQRPSTEALSTEASANDPISAMFGQMLQALGPMMVALGAGSMIGGLSHNALGQYDLPVPRPTREVLVVPAALAGAAKQWDLPLAELQLWVLIHELATHAVLSVPHVSERLDALFIDFANAFDLDPSKLFDQFGDMNDPSQMLQLSESLGDPDVIFSSMRTPMHDILVPQLDALISVVLGFVDHTVSAVAADLLPAHGAIRDALRQRATEVSEEDRFMERVLGIEVTADTLDRGTRFIQGITDRAGDAALLRLWADELDLPTPAEVDAPGLWLARIGLDPDLPDGALDVPDDLSELDGE